MSVRFRLHAFASLALWTTLWGCAHAPARPSGQAQDRSPAVLRFDEEPMKVEAVRGSAGTRIEAYDAAGLFEQAGQDLEAERFAEAAAAYDRLVAEFPRSRFTAAALYNAGLAYEGLRRWDDAAERYRRRAEAGGKEGDMQDALHRMGACLAEAGRWAESLQVWERLLGRKDLSLSDQIEAMSRKGLAQLELSDLEGAERTFRQTLTHFKDNETVERLDTDYYVAMSQFYLGRVSHLYMRRLPLRLQHLEADVEAKARMFLTAQARYIDTVRVKNPVWATAAGYQIGALYRELYDLLITAPLPAELDSEEKRGVYQDLLGEKLRVLLVKARHIHEKNVEMAERVGVRNGWVERSTEQLAELDGLLRSLPQPKGRAQ
jgi:tetratricopeptide (TPR) repeat protein